MRDLIIRALQDYNNTDNQRQIFQAIAQNNNGYGGGLGLLAQAIAGYQNGKLARRGQDQLAELRQLENQEEQERERQAQEQEAAQRQAKIELEDRRAQEKRAFEMQLAELRNENQLARDQSNQSFTANQNQLNRDAAQARFKQQEALRANQGVKLTSEEAQIQRAVQQGLISEDEANNRLRDNALGTKKNKELSGELKNKLGLLENAERDLLKFKDQAFKNGDFQEIGSKFGNTQSLFESAVLNTLRAESGAAIGKDELSNFKDIYGASMFNSDETNEQKIDTLLEKIKTQKKMLLEGQANEQTTEFNIDNSATNNLLNKYGGL